VQDGAEQKLRKRASSLEVPEAMSSPLLARTARASYRARCTQRPSCRPANLRASQSRPFFSFLKKKAGPTSRPKAPESILSQDNLFHPFSKSPFKPIRDRGEAIKKLAPCPVCTENASTSASASGNDHIHAEPTKKHVEFECPDCGWPTHCSEEHWKADEEHQRYCGRLKESNEDEHDLRSGRRMTEFEPPGSCLI
jgi:mitochondrial splicing suppressor protein 51